MKYVPLFILIQLASAVLFVIGIPLCAILAYGDFSTIRDGGAHHWPKWAWLWDNEEDGVAPYWYTQANKSWSERRDEFVWSAFRNPVNNLRFVRGVSDVTRPLWRKTWGAKPGGFYVQAGWNHSGYPVCSGGRNINPW